MIDISVVVPTYNVEPYIVACLDSINNQSIDNYEIICVDDGSTDATCDIIEKYIQNDKSQKIRLLKNLNNIGAARARNRGMEEAKGEYIIFLDSDDTYDSRLLEKLFNAIVKNKADVAICEFNYCDAEGKTVRTDGWTKNLFCKDIVVSTDSKEHLFGNITWTPWNKLVRKAFLQKNNIKFQDIKTSNDVFYSIIVVTCAEKIVFVPEVLVNYRSEREGNISHNKIDKIDYIICAFEAIIVRLKENGLWKTELKTGAMGTIITFCYSMVIKSNEKTAQYYLEEWKSRIMPLISDAEVILLDNNWWLYQYLFLCGRMDFCKNTYQLCHVQIQETLEKLYPQKIALWGAGKLAHEFLDSIPNIKKHIECVVDNDIEKQGKKIRDIAICSYESVYDRVDKFIVLNERYINEVIDQVGDKDKIINMKQIIRESDLMAMTYTSSPQESDYKKNQL